VLRDTSARELVSVPVVMQEMGLGINGALVYDRARQKSCKRLQPLARAERDMRCRYSMEYVVANLDWLEAKLQPLQDKFVGARACFVLLRFVVVDAQSFVDVFIGWVC